jgi:hypothetical protein
MAGESRIASETVLSNASPFTTKVNESGPLNAIRRSMPSCAMTMNGERTAGLCAKQPSYTMRTLRHGATSIRSTAPTTSKAADSGCQNARPVPAVPPAPATAWPLRALHFHAATPSVLLLHRAGRDL